MQKLVAALVFLALFAHFSYAIPPAVETEAQIALVAQQEITRTVTFTLTMEAPISGDVPEMVGRKYSSTVALTSIGLVVNDNGGVITESSLMNDSVLIDRFIEQIEPTIIADIANAEHVKKFGEVATAEGVTQYRLYFLSTYGSLKSLYYKNPNLFNIQKTAETISLKSFPVEIKSSANDSIILVQTNGTNTTSVLFSINNTAQVGDTVYIAGINSSANQTIETAVITSKDNDTLSLSKEVNSTSIVMDKDGTVIGILEANSNSLLSGESIAEILNQNGIANNESYLTRLYRDGLNAYQAGDYETAANKLDPVVEAYPSNSLRQYLEDSKVKSLPNKIFSAIKSFIFGNLFWIGLAVMAILGILIIPLLPVGLVFIKRFTKRR